MKLRRDWIFVAVIFVLSLYVIFIHAKTGLFFLSAKQAGKKALDYINEKFAEPGSEARLIRVNEISGIYEVLIFYRGREIPVYITKDGKYLFVSPPLDTSEKLREEKAEDAYSGLTNKSANCITKLNLSTALIEDCVRNGLELARQEYDLTQQYNARGSPTIFFNGKRLDPVRVFGDRSTLSFKKILCCSFEDVPTECKNLTNCSGIDLPKWEKPEIKVFVMAFCPYGVGVLKSLVPLYNEFKDKVRFDVHYVMYGTRENPESMHGSEELNQDITQLCIRKYYGEDAFWNYISCYYGVSGIAEGGSC